MEGSAPFPHDRLSSVVSIALSKPDLSVLSEMLLEIARQIDAEGCALWAMEPRFPGMNDFPGKSEEKILAIAAGFENRLHYPEHDLPAEVPSGNAIRTGIAQPVPDVFAVKMPERATA